MDTSQITNTLRRIYEDEQPRLVFWYDAGREFGDELEKLVPEGVTLLRLDQLGALEVKIKIELEDTTSRFLIYVPQEIPAPEEDWLLDVRLYSRAFTADTASILLDELGLPQQTLRDHIAQRQLFFRSQDRLNRLKKWTNAEDRAEELDKKMLAVVVRADQPETFAILLKLFAEISQNEGVAYNQPPHVWNDIEKYGLAPYFWKLMREAFGYEQSEPKLYDLLIRLLITDFSNNLRVESPAALKHFELSNRARALNSSVFLSHWRSNISHYKTYNRLSRHIERETKLNEHVAQLPADALRDCETFESVERRIISGLRDRVLAGGETLDLTELHSFIQQRRDGYWSRGESSPYRFTYDALEAAAELLALRHTFEHGFTYASAGAMFRAYTDELFRFDQLYRLFHEAAAQVKMEGWNVLAPLRDAVEGCYGNWYIDHLAAAWGELIEDTSGGSLLQKWQLEGVPNQQHFYRKHVQPLLDAAPQSKVYVVISDALRYEAAEELMRELNGRYRFKASLSVQLGVVPSYTALGMAALLPQQNLDYKVMASGLDVLADDLSTAGVVKRAEVLERVKGTAVKFEELISKGKEDGREFVKPFRVIYVYHNRIDATGDVAASEHKTFNAVREAIDELSGIVKHIVNNLNGSQVLITADHGFLYQETQPAQSDKSGLELKPAGARVSKKRYLIGTELGDRLNVWHGRIRDTAGIVGEMEFWVPKGANRFHFVSGARFIHGGAMLQEIAVPIVSVKSLRGSAAEKTQVRKVEVSRLGSSTRIVNNVQRFEFIQTEAVSERVQPRTLIISLRDANNKEISDESTVTFNSHSELMDERKKTVQLILKAGQYDKHGNYYLVLRDAENDIEYQRTQMTIDIAFTNDF
jgi:uncharacterized protein (TIGR02687 family)